MIDLKSTSVVAIGSFNPAIIQSGWLAKCGLIEESKEIRIGFLVGSVNPPITIEYDDLTWRVTLNKFEVANRNVDKVCDLGAMMGKALEKLPFTPVSGLGHNFIFEFKEDQLMLENFFKNKLGEGHEVFGPIEKLEEEISFKTSENKTTNLKITLKNNSKVISINCHYKVSNIDELVSYSGEYKKNLDLIKNTVPSFLGN